MLTVKHHVDRLLPPVIMLIRYLISQSGEQQGKELLQHITRQMQDAVLLTLSSIDEVKLRIDAKQ